MHLEWMQRRTEYLIMKNINIFLLLSICNINHAICSNIDKYQYTVQPCSILCIFFSDRFTSYFSKYGEIADSVIMTDKYSGRPRGFGFVTFADSSVADKVLEECHVIDGREVIFSIPVNFFTAQNYFLVMLELSWMLYHVR